MMLYKFLVVICFFTLFNNANAELIEWDAFNVGDNLAVKDNDSGLVWLDLSQTAGENYVDAGTLFVGWEHASYNHVEDLLDSVFPDIVFSGPLGTTYSFEEACAYSTVANSCYQSAKTWQDLFGATVGDVYYQTIAFGMYEDENHILSMGGSFVNGSGNANRYSVDFDVNYSVNYDNRYANNEFTYYSSFLLLTSSLPVQQIQTIQLKQTAMDVNEPDIEYMFMFVVGGLLIARRG